MYYETAEQPKFISVLTKKMYLCVPIRTAGPKQAAIYTYYGEETTRRL